METCPVCLKGKPTADRLKLFRYREEFYGSDYLGLGTIKAYECLICEAELYYAFANHSDYPRLVTAKQYNSASEIAGNDWIGSTCGEYTKRISRGVTPPKGV